MWILSVEFSFKFCGCGYCHYEVFLCASWMWILSLWSFPFIFMDVDSVSISLWSFPLSFVDVDAVIVEFMHCLSAPAGKVVEDEL